MGQLSKSTGAHKAITAGVVCVYLTIACGVNLFHTEDCPLTTGKTAPSSESCPACKFLAGANSTPALYESSLIATNYQMVSAPAPDSIVVVSQECIGSIIILRGPPPLTLS
jgi:hypothetical protein